MLTSSLGVAAPSVTLAAACSPDQGGPTTVIPIVEAGATPWAALSINNGCVLNYDTTPGGSSEGLTGARNNVYQLAASSRPLRAGNEIDQLHAWKVARDAMVFQVSTNTAMNFITQITPVQVQGIFKGTIQNWNEGGLGGPAQPIRAVCRNSDSGTYGDMHRLFNLGSDAVQGVNDAGCDVRVLTSADEAAEASNPFTIVYTSLANIGVGSTKELQLSGDAAFTQLDNAPGTPTLPSVANVANGTYPAPRELFLAVKEFQLLPGGASTATDNTDYVKAYEYINYILSSAGQAIVNAEGFVGVPTFVPFPYSDVDLNGVVALGDLGKITGRWTQSDSTPGWVRGDADRNGVIALGDIGVVTGKWGSTAPGNAFQPSNG
jgi:ABC-type phosphate transport system substrate-binding protein